MQVGEPVGAWWLPGRAEFSRLIQGKTKVDIVLVPAGTILLGGLVGTWIGPVVVLFMTWFGNLINRATELHPFPMGISFLP